MSKERNVSIVWFAGGGQLRREDCDRLVDDGEWIVVCRKGVKEVWNKKYLEGIRYEPDAGNDM